MPGQRFGGMLGVAPDGSRPKAFGELALRVVDAVRLMTQLIGRADPGTADDEALRWVGTEVMRAAKNVIMLRIVRKSPPTGPEVEQALIDETRDTLASVGLAIDAIENLMVR